MGNQTAVKSLVDRRITATVKAFIAGRELRVEDIAAGLRSSRSGLYHKLKGGSPWTATEVAALAEMFGISVNDLYTGLSGTFAQATGTWAEQEGTWAGAGRGPVNSGWRSRRNLRLVEPPADTVLPAAA
jgi:hypothetical protein